MSPFPSSGQSMRDVVIETVPGQVFHCPENDRRPGRAWRVYFRSIPFPRFVSQ